MKEFIMNKNILKAITYTAFATTIAACTSGGGSNNSVLQAPFTATYLAPPTDATSTIVGSGYYSTLEGSNICYLCT